MFVPWRVRPMILSASESHKIVPSLSDCSHTTSSRTVRRILPAPYCAQKMLVQKKPVHHGKDFSWFPGGFFLRIGICPCFKEMLLEFWRFGIGNLMLFWFHPKKKTKDSLHWRFFWGEPLKWGAEIAMSTVLCEFFFRISRWFFFENLTSKNWARRELPAASSSEISTTLRQDLSFFMDQNDLWVSLWGGR